MNEYILAYLETALPRFPIEGVKRVREHLTSTAILANISSNIGTKDIILAAVCIH